MPVTTDDFSLDQVEREQQQQTHRRREKQSRRRHLYVLGTLSVLLLVAVGAPSLASHSSLGRSLLIHSLAQYEFESSVESIRIGWVTPLRIQGLRLHGARDSEIAIDELDADVTVGDLIRSGISDFGEVSVRGVSIRCRVDDGRCNLEDDLQALLQPSDEPSSFSAQFKLQEVTLDATDAVAGATWRVSQSSAEGTVTPNRTEVSFAGVLTEPGGGGGSLQGAVLYSPQETADRSSVAESSQCWRLEITCESLPLSAASLVRRRVTELAPYVPKTIHGDATGRVRVQSFHDGTIETMVDDLRVRNLTAADEGSRVWSNGLATIRGELVLRGERVIGRQLMAATDFASATIDGAFSRTFSLVGANDNPLRWLDAIDGVATAEIDLAAFDRSLPGVLPLRDDAIIQSGRVTAKLESAPNGQTRRSQLRIETESLRARSRGQAVVIDPIRLSASVFNDRGKLRAEQFEWKSAFGSAIGHGDLQSGVADFEVDFGRLTAMLRPIIKVSETSLAGAASGKVQWNASADSTWRLSGAADANDLLITFPGGQSLKRQSLRGAVDAVGSWGGQSLQELSSVNLSVVSNGLDLKAELMEPVPQPTAEKPLGVRISGTGRLETLTEAMGPFLPKELSELSGGFQFTANTSVSSSVTRFTLASLTLTEPMIRYDGRRFGQSKVQVDFTGNYQLPGNELDAEQWTIAGTAFSMRIAGKASQQVTKLDIQFRALLDRLQGSVSTSIAAAGGSTPFRPVGYRTDQAIGDDHWSLLGDCEGSVVVRGQQGLIDMEIDALARNLALVQPPQSNPQYQLVGPQPAQRQTSNSAAARSGLAARTVWAEPNMKIVGLVRYDPIANSFTSEALQVSGDWFATTLQGRFDRRPQGDELLLEGPARMKMHEVAARLSTLLGMSIRAEGVQETPLMIRAGRDNQGGMQVSARAVVGWETAEVAGVPFGQASIPVRLNETSVEITPSRVPVGAGFVNLAGQVHYRPGPVWVQLDRGVVAESVRLTPEMTHRWLKYLAPLAADATQVDGTIGAELDEAIIVLESPERSRVVGRLNVGSVQLNAGPLANQVIGTVNQLKSLAGANSLGANSPGGGTTNVSATNPAKTLVRMPAQTVDFSVNQGTVTHERLFFELDRAQVVTSGRVAFDGRLNMIAMVPLDARWLGSDLKGLAGQTVTLPIDGTLSRPSLDSSGVAQVVTQLGVQAVQSSAENYLQQQLNRGMDKLFGR